VPLVFSYGTLREPAVQRATYGRLLEGGTDALTGFTLERVAIADPARAAALGRSHHANARRTGSVADRVDGMAFEITDAELAATDGYERPDGYVRRAVTLASGRAAWMYVDSRSADHRG